MRRMQPSTLNNYDFYEVLSSLQKEIRRGNEENALFWALELESSTKIYKKALWNRLRVIASEDIGIANILMPILIDTLNRAYDAKQELLFVAHAVLALCRSPKSRIVDDFCIVVQRIKHLDIPDYALDMHTFRGQLKNRGKKHFHEIGSKLANESTTIKNIYKNRSEKEGLAHE